MSERFIMTVHQTLTGWAKQLVGAPNPQSHLQELRRAELRAKTEIRAALNRLAAGFDVLAYEVDEAMVQIDDVLGDITSEVERDLTYEIEQHDQY